MTTELLGEDGARNRAPDVSDYDMVGPYRLLQQLGEGGMGVVHLALDPHGKAVAIKVLRPHIAHDPDARTRLQREVDTLGRVDDPRVAAVLDADIDCDQPYIVTRYVPGPTLEEVVRETGPIARRDLHRLGSGLAEALHAIHQADVIHRDLKPGNVLLLDGDPVLIDFGIAHVADDVRLTMTGMVMGTPGYLSPEVVEGAAVSEATDWWGWAATLAFAASGMPPFGRGPMEAVLARVGRGDADLSRVDPALAPLLAAALCPDPTRRPDDRVVVDALGRYAAGEPVTDVLRVARLGADSETTVLAAAPTQVMEQSGTEALPPAAGAAVAAASLSGVSDVAAPGSTPAGDVPASGDDVAGGRAVPTGADPQEGDVSRGDPDATGRPGAGTSVDVEPWRPPPPEASDVEPWPGTVPDGREGDPRIGRPKRSGVFAALLALAVAGAAVVPVTTLLAVLGWSLFARMTDRSMTSLVLRRHRNGRRRSDVPVAVVSGPWHLVIAAVRTLAAAVLPLVIALSGVFCTAIAISLATGGGPQPGGTAPLVVGMALGALMAWWGPGGASLRRGSRSMVRVLTPGGTSAGVLSGLLLTVAAAAGVWAYLHLDAALWWPLSGAPAPFGSGGITLP